MICEYCKHVNKDYARVCRHCGAPLKNAVRSTVLSGGISGGKNDFLYEVPRPASRGPNKPQPVSGSARYETRRQPEREYGRTLGAKPGPSGHESPIGKKPEPLKIKQIKTQERQPLKNPFFEEAQAHKDSKKQKPASLDAGYLDDYGEEADAPEDDDAFNKRFLSILVSLAATVIASVAFLAYLMFLKPVATPEETAPTPSATASPTAAVTKAPTPKPSPIKTTEPEATKKP